MSYEKGQVLSTGRARGFPAYTVLVFSSSTGSLERTRAPPGLQGGRCLVPRVSVWSRAALPLLAVCDGALSRAEVTVFQDEIVVQAYRCTRMLQW